MSTITTYNLRSRAQKPASPSITLPLEEESVICPNCQSTEAEYDLDQDHLACKTCGQLVTFGDTFIDMQDDTYVFRGRKPIEPVEYFSVLYSRYSQLAPIFINDPHLFLSGQELIKKLKKELKHTRKYAAETALAIIIHVAKPVKPKGWNVDDYISACNDKYTIQKSRVMSILKNIKGQAGYKEFMDESAKEQLDYVIDHIYQAILVSIMSLQLAPTSTSVASTALKATSVVSEPPSQLSKQNIKEYTRQLMELGRKYELNGDKQIRSLITAVACLVATCLREKIPVKFNRQTKLSNSAVIRDRKRKREWYRKKNRPLYIWDFSSFSMITYNQPEYIRKIYLEYYRLLRKCVNKIPWEEKPIPIARVACYLDEVLNLFGGENPELKVELEVPSSFKMNMKTLDERKLELQRAKEWIKRKKKPNKEDPVYNVYTLLANGYKEEDILVYNPKRLDEEVDFIEVTSELGYIKKEEVDERKEKDAKKGCNVTMVEDKRDVKDLKTASSKTCNGSSQTTKA